MGLSEISQTEMEFWDGPKHYVSIQHVNKPNNKSTNMKLVINSSLKCPRTCTAYLHKCGNQLPRHISSQEHLPGTFGQKKLR